MNTTDIIKFKKKQKRLLIWTIFAVSIFVIAWMAGIYRHVFGFDPHWAGDNFVFNLTFLFPATIFSILVCYITGCSTIANFKNLPNKKISLLTILLSLSLIFYVGYYIIMVLRQH